MKEERIFMELRENNDGTISITNGGGSLNHGQMESFDDLDTAIADLNKRISIEYRKMCK